MVETTRFAPSVTIIVVTWNSALDIEECLSSIFQQSHPNYHVIVVDSCSTDRTLEIVRSQFPDVEIIASPENIGYRRGNRLGMQAAQGDYVLVCNDDVVVDSDWLTAMVGAMEQDGQIGMVTPRIVMYDQPDRMNVAGNMMHYTGIYGSKAKNASVAQYLTATDVAAVSGCCFMIRRDLMHRVGGFSEDFDRIPNYWHASFEDADLSWRVRALGYRIRYVAGAVMYHKYKQPAPDNVGRFAELGSGWWLFALRNFEVSALLMLLPAMLLVEIFLLAFAVVKGPAWWMAKLRTWHWFLTHSKEWREMRRNLQPMRQQSYWRLLPMLHPTLEATPSFGGDLGRVGLGALNLILSAYYRFLLAISPAAPAADQERQPHNQHPIVER